MNNLVVVGIAVGFLSGSFWAGKSGAQMQESPQIATPSADTTLVDDFVAVDEVISDPTIPLTDPEFDEAGNWATWQLGPNAQVQGLLLVAQIDPDTGDIIDPQTGLWLTEGGLGQVIDTGLVTRDLTKNGPEWATAAGGSRLLYSKLNELNQPSLAEAKYDGNIWVTQLLNYGQNRFTPEGSKDTDDMAPRVAYASFKNDGTGLIRKTAMRLVDYAFTERIAPVKLNGYNFIPNDSAILGTAIAPDNLQQVMLWDYVVGTVEQITFDTGTKQQTPEAWIAPEAGNDVMFAVQARYNTQTIGRVYKREPGTDGNPVWVQHMQFISPDPSKPFIGATRPFVYQGKSYISLKVQPVRGDNFGVDFYIIDLVVDPAQRLIRKISSDEFLYRYDQEIFTTTNGPVIYYSEVTLQGIHVLHRMQTGL